MYHINLHPTVQSLLHEDYRRRSGNLYQRVNAAPEGASSGETMLAVPRLALLKALVKGRLAFSELDGLSTLRRQQA